MAYNLKRSRTPIGRIREFCPEVRLADLEGASTDEIEKLASRLESMTKVASHGPGGSLGPSWIEGDYNPYSPSPYTTHVPNLGGGPRDEPRSKLPGGQDPLSGGRDRAKNYPTSGHHGKFPGEVGGKDGVTRPGEGADWEVSFSLREWDDPDSVKMWLGTIGGNVEFDGRRMAVFVGSYEDAILIQRKFTGTIISRRRDVT
jgi:hypothetical protein